MRPNRRGAVLVIFAASLMTFISFMALVIDVGYLYALKARIQAVCDTTAAATVAALDPAKPIADQQRFAVALARRMLEANGLQLPNYEIKLEASTSPDSVARVTIGGREVLNAFFAQAIAKDGFVVGVWTDATVIKEANGKLRAVLKD